MRIKAFVSGILLLLLLVCVAPSYVAAIPALPHAFYGTLTLNNAPAPAGTQVSATGTGVTTGVPQNPLTTTTAGQYGNGGLYLLVQGDIQDGATITFLVNGVSTGQTAIWHSGATTELNLSVTITTTTTSSGGTGGVITSNVVTNFSGTQSSFKVDSSGVVQTAFSATSADGKLTMNIPVGTKALDKNGNPLTSMTETVFTNPPAPPANANIIGLAYDFGPAGATFNPPITFTWTYDPATLPAGVTEASLDIAYYNTATSQWVALHGVVNMTTHTITASIPHYTAFAIIGTITQTTTAIPTSTSTTTSTTTTTTTTSTTTSTPTSTPTSTSTPASTSTPTSTPPSTSTPKSTSTVAVVSNEFNWGVMGGIIGGVVIIGLVIVFIAVRRRKA